MNFENIHRHFGIQMLLPEIEEQGQQKLLNAKVLVIGAGGLGCPCLQYLVAAGVGHIGICDGDVVEQSNLHRQTLYNSGDLGQLKSLAAAEKLNKVFTGTGISTFNHFLSNATALHLFRQYDLVIDCTDDMHTRFMISDACILLQKPLLYAAVYRFESQIALFNTSSSQINLRDVFDEEKHHSSISCNESGVLGAITGITGSMQALEAIKYICNMPSCLQDEWLMCDFANYRFYRSGILPDHHSRKYIPADIADFLNRDYRQICFKKHDESRELDAEAFLKKIREGNVQVVDVRAVDEKPAWTVFASVNIPLDELLSGKQKINNERDILLFCHAGIRSFEAMEYLLEECGFQNVYHLKGGIIKWDL